MKSITLNTPHHNNGHGPVDERIPTPWTQSDSKSSTPISTKLPNNNDMFTTASLRIEFSHTEPTSFYKEPTGPEAAKWLAQIRDGRLNSQANSIA